MSVKEIIFVIVICLTIHSAIGGRKNKTKNKEVAVQEDNQDVLQDNDEDKVYALSEFHNVGKGVRVELDSLNFSHRATSGEIEAREEGRDEAKTAPVWWYNDENGQPVYKGGQKKSSCFGWCC